MRMCFAVGQKVLSIALGLFVLLCSASPFSSAFASSGSVETDEVVILDRPESKLAGILNTELIPAKAYQTDLTLGHVWYGIDNQTNIFTTFLLTLLLSLEALP